MSARPLTTVAAMLAAAAALAACGTSNSARTVQTVTVTRTDTSASVPRPNTTTPPGAGSSQSPSRTRTEAAPSFSGGTSASGSPSGARSSAMARLRSQGFTAVDTSVYHSDQTLRVLIGARTGSADQRTQRAFFFNGTRYLGTDTADASAQIRVGAQSDTQVTLSYGIYRSGDPLCCPRGGKRSVRFQLDMGRLAPVDPLPSAAERR